MPITKKSRTNAFNSMKSYLQTLTTNLSDFNTGSILLSMFDTVAAELEQLYNAQDQIQSASFISTATGVDLDNKVADFTLERRGATYAGGILTFGRTTASTQDYTIPTGTAVATSATSSTPGVQFETIEEVILSAGSLTVTANARCKSYGIVGNVSANSITVLSSPPAGIEYVNNYNAMSGGQDEESDDELRARLTLYLNSLSRGTKLALESAGLSITGVSSVSVLENRTPGSDLVTPGYVTMYIADATGTATQDVLDAVSNVVEDYRPVSVIVYVVAPVVQYVDVSCFISVDPAYDSGDVIAAVTSSISSYLASLKLDENISRSHIIDAIVNTEGVVDLDTTIEPKVVDESKNAFLTTVYNEAQTSVNKGKVTVDEAAKTVIGVYLAYDTSKIGKNFVNTVDNKNISTLDLPIVDEIQTSVTANRIDVNYEISEIDAVVSISNPARTVDGVWAYADTGHVTNLYTTGSYFSGKSIFLANPLSPSIQQVRVQYKEVEGTNTQTDVIVDYQKQQINTTYTAADVEGVWVDADTTHTGTNYYIDGSFAPYATPPGSVITLGTTTPGATDLVRINYWKEEGGTGLKPYDNVVVENGRIGRPRNITINLL